MACSVLEHDVSNMPHTFEVRRVYTHCALTPRRCRHDKRVRPRFRGCKRFPVRGAEVSAQCGLFLRYKGEAALHCKLEQNPIKFCFRMRLSVQAMELLFFLTSCGKTILCFCLYSRYQPFSGLGIFAIRLSRISASICSQIIPP